MIPFWIIFAACGIIGIPCVLLFASGGATAKRKVFGSLAGVVMWFMLAGGMYFQEVGNTERWNEGQCECGTHWELSAVTRSRTGTETKYYTCPSCHNEIKIVY